MSSKDAGRKIAYMNLHTTLFVPSLSGGKGLNLPEVLTAKFQTTIKGSGMDMTMGEGTITVVTPEKVEFGIPLTQCKLWVFEPAAPAKK